MLTWDTQYSVHIQEFDAQHRTLLAKIAELHKVASKGTGADAMTRLFDNLMDYTRKHFESEEQVMRRRKFTGYPAHRAEHQALLMQANDFHRKFLEGKTMIGMEIMRYLNDWLLNHINVMDRQYDAFFHKKGAPEDQGAKKLRGHVATFDN